MGQQEELLAKEEPPKFTIKNVTWIILADVKVHILCSFQNIKMAKYCHLQPHPGESSIKGLWHYSSHG